MILSLVITNSGVQNWRGGRSAVLSGPFLSATNDKGVWKVYEDVVLKEK